MADDNSGNRGARNVRYQGVTAMDEIPSRVLTVGDVATVLNCSQSHVCDESARTQMTPPILLTDVIYRTRYKRIRDYSNTWWAGWLIVGAIAACMFAFGCQKPPAPNVLIPCSEASLPCPDVEFTQPKTPIIAPGEYDEEQARDAICRAFPQLKDCFNIDGYINAN